MNSSAISFDRAANLPKLDQVLSRDRYVLMRALDQITKKFDPAQYDRWRARVELSRSARIARAASLPLISVPEDLPIAARADEIIQSIKDHRVIVLAGETGSGKTTQLPKLCLAAGRGVAGLIGCTQPRRIAARNVARRVAQEINTPLGELIGFQVRFTDQVSERSLVKFMTDGILLAETQNDAWLNQYDTLIIDEAHERSLNIDFLLGFLKNLSRKRPELRIIVTSATIDTEKFARHFDGAKIIEVEGRSYPVEVRYRPLNVERADDRAGARSDNRAGDRSVLDAIASTLEEITRDDPRNDVLVFLPGEREIRDAHAFLEKRNFRETEILPLYARLSNKDQDRVFNPGPKRRVVLATNVAETSLTVPRIRYVIDPGTARVNRYSHRLKVQRLHIENISQAAADQRKGRCGRVSAGVCYRLYEEAEFALRDRYTEPEILRSSLANVILRLMSLKLGAVEVFPFVDVPESRAINDGFQHLYELGAISLDRKQLTPIGRDLARLPVDVKLARMLEAARKHKCLREMITLAAFLSIQDPRERPHDAKQAADLAQAEFVDNKSDFASVLKLWIAYDLAHEELTQSRLRDWCEARFLNFMRMREWRELHRQLLLQTDELGWSLNTEPAQYDALHRALISGFPTQIAERNEKQEYVGTRGRKYTIFPSSGLLKTAPKWLLSAALLDTQKLFGLMNARIEPEWAEQELPHLIKRSYFDPAWSRAQGAVIAFEQVNLFGLSLVAKRRVQFGPIDPLQAHEIFLREALLNGEIDCKSKFTKLNLATLDAAYAEEAKQRRRGLLKDESELIAWLGKRIPTDIYSARGLDAWYAKLDANQRAALCWSLDDVMSERADRAQMFPDYFVLGLERLKLDYKFDPTDHCDGVSVTVPLALLNALPTTRTQWLVPGMLEARVAEMIRALPKSLRRNFVPAPNFAQAFAESVNYQVQDMALSVALTKFLFKSTGVEVPSEEWRESDLPKHLRLNLRLLDEDGELLCETRDIDALQVEYAERARKQFVKQTSTTIARDALLQFELDDIPVRVNTASGLSAFPALVDNGGSVDLRVFERELDANRAHVLGVKRLLRIALSDKLKQWRKQLPLTPKLALAYSPLASPDLLRDDVVEGAFHDLCNEANASVRTRAGFELLQNDIARRGFAFAVERLKPVELSLQVYAALRPELHPPLMGFGKANYDDLQAQLKALVFAGFARCFSQTRLLEIPRYLEAMRIRIKRLQLDPRKDQARMLSIFPYSEALQKYQNQSDHEPEQADRLRWMIEELRVQLFAQELGTREAISEKRLDRAFEQAGIKK